MLGVERDVEPRSATLNPGPFDHVRSFGTRVFGRFLHDFEIGSALGRDDLEWA